jgi:phosphate transport system substrate-binding protein
VIRILTVASIVWSACGGAGCGRPQGGGGAGGRVMIQNKGSDTMVNLAQAWAEGYRAVAPDVGVAVSGGGSGTGIAAIINGTVDIANASREIEPREADLARKNTGKDPVRHVVALDALAVIVHPQNPLAEIALPEVACIYGAEGTCAKWSDLRVEVPGCAGQQIVRASRQNNSGTYHYFREVVLGKKDFRLGSRDMNGSKEVVDLVAHTPCAIGYTGVGYLSAGVKALCVAAAPGQPCKKPSMEASISGEYPIARDLYMYTLGPAQGAAKNYLDWILSDAGQAAVAKAGYIPVPKERRGK